MEVVLTCGSCGSAVPVRPSPGTRRADCPACSRGHPVRFGPGHLAGDPAPCPSCGRRDLYRQKDFNRRAGVLLFALAAVLSVWTYGLSLVALWLVDLLLHRRLGDVAVCYKCRAVFRNAAAAALARVPPFDHETNDRVVHAGHDFGGLPPGKRGAPRPAPASSSAAAAAASPAALRTPPEPPAREA